MLRYKPVVCKNSTPFDLTLQFDQKHCQEDWLNIVVTASARHKIRDALREEKKLIAEEGKEMVKRKFNGLKVDFLSKNIDELVDVFNSQKVCLTTFVKKNFKDGIHFIEQKQMNLSLPDYLLLKKKSFFFKLITCPICCSFWMSMIYYRSIVGVCAACFSYLIYKLLIK